MARTATPTATPAPVTSRPDVDPLRIAFRDSCFSGIAGDRNIASGLAEISERVTILAGADPKTKAELYASLGISLCCQHDRRVVTVEAQHPGHVHKERVGGRTFENDDWRVATWSELLDETLPT